MNMKGMAAMKIYAVNGSPRKNGTTATLLESALDGARSAAKDAKTEIINLYDYTYKGCISCYSCKRKGSPSLYRCAVRDELTPVLEKISYADGVIFGTPIYLRGITSGMHALIERLCFPYLSLNKRRESLAPRKVKTGAIYTMNMSPEQLGDKWDIIYEPLLNTKSGFLESIFGSYEKLYVCNTPHFDDDYSNYEAAIVDAGAKAKARREQFPIDMVKAFEMGARIATE